MNYSFLILIAISALSASCNTTNNPKERHVTINTKAIFKQNPFSYGGTYYTLEIDSNKEHRSVYWPAHAPAPDSLEASLTYTVELIEEVYCIPIEDRGRIYLATEVVRFSSGGRLLYDASLCSVHGIKMERVVVPVPYGRSMFGRKYTQALKADFPNSGMMQGGQGEPGLNSDRRSTGAWVCPTCVARKKLWEQQNPTEKKTANKIR